jgi:hypothetical protein
MRKRETGMTNDPEDHRPWFGSKRVGWGLRPQTWQGWLITAAFVVLLIAIATWAR